MKLLLRVVGGIVILLIVAVIVLYFSLNIIVARVIMTYGPGVTQTPVKVSFVNISPLSGAGKISNLTIDSPTDYKEQPAIKIKDIEVKIDMKSILTKKIIIDEVVIDTPEVNFEQKFTSNNISAIRANVNSYNGRNNNPSTPSALKFQINRLVIKSGKATIYTAGAHVLFPISDVDDRNIGAGENGVTSSEITKLVFSTFTESVLKGVASGALLKEGAGSIGEGIKSLFGH